MGIGLTVSQYLPSPQPNGAVTTPAAGSGIAGGTYSIAVVACFDQRGLETDMDTFGVDRSTRVAHAWDGIVVAAGDNVVIPITPPTLEGVNDELYPHHYIVLAQVAAAYVFTSAGTIVHRTTGGLMRTITVTDDTSLGSVTLGSTGPSIALSQVFGMEWSVVPPHTMVASGGPRPRTRTSRNMVSRAKLIFPPSAADHSELSRMHKWLGAGIVALVTEAEDSNAETDAPIKEYHGLLVDTNFSNSIHDEQSRLWYDFVPHHTEVSSSIPLGDPSP